MNGDTHFRYIVTGLFFCISSQNLSHFFFFYHFSPHLPSTHPPLQDVPTIPPLCTMLPNSSNPLAPMTHPTKRAHHHEPLLPSPAKGSPLLPKERPTWEPDTPSKIQVTTSAGKYPTSPATTPWVREETLAGVWGEVAKAQVMWGKLAADSATRPYLGYFLSLCGAVFGGAVFPLMDAYEEPALLKVGSRNVFIAAGCCYYALTHDTTRLSTLHAQMKLRGRTIDPLVSLTLLCGITHGLISIFNQICLQLNGGEVASVLTNCSCVVALAVAYMSGEFVTDVGKKATCGVVVIVLYMLVVVRPALLGVLAGVGASVCNAMYYVGSRQAKNLVSLPLLLAMVYVVSSVFIIGSTLLLGQTSVTDWLSAFFNVYYVIPTIFVAALTFAFQASLVMALKYCSPVVVTGAMSLEPIATFGIDWIFGKPTPDNHTMFILFLLMAATTVISFNGQSGVARKVSTGSKV